MEKKDLDEVSNAIDEIMSLYEKDRSIVFGGAEPQLGAFIGAIGDSLRKWKRSTKCIYFSCPHNSIKQSHTIQKSSSLRLLSEAGHVFGPSMTSKGDIEVRKVGISDASTFPGFCEKHEQLFEDYENQRALSKEQHYILQIYRTVCRELVRIDHAVKQTESFLSFFENKRNTALKSLLKKKLGASSRAKKICDEIKSFQMTNDPGLDKAQRVIKQLSKTKSQIEAGILKELKAAIEDPSNNTVSAFVLTLSDVQLPVCLAGMAGFDVEENGARRGVTIFLNILPFEKETKLIFCTQHSDFVALNNYLAVRSDSISMVNMIESWMTNGTDHWFMRPSDWAALGESRQKKVVDGIQGNNSILEFFQHSILDDIRKSLIDSARAQLNTPGKEEYFSRIIREESLKLSD